MVTTAAATTTIAVTAAQVPATDLLSVKQVLKHVMDSPKRQRLNDGYQSHELRDSQ